MGVAAVSKIALVLFAVPVTCTVMCNFRVEPVHGWMMRHHCPLAGLTTHPPSRSIYGRQGSAEQHSAQVTTP